MIHGELQNLFENLKQDFKFELKERDERIRLYKNLWSDAETAVNSMLSEMKLIKMEFEIEKLKKRNRGTLEFGNIDSQTPANKEAVNSGNCLPVNLDIKGNDLDHTAIQTLKEKATCVLENLAITELFAAVSEMHRSLRILLSFFLFWVIEVKCRP